MNTTIIENNNLKPFIIFSVHQKALSDAENTTNHNIVLEHLKGLSKPFKEVLGVYTYDDGETVSEDSFLLSGDDIDFVCGLCEQYNQECFLLSTSDRSTVLVDRNKEWTKRLGKFQAVSEYEAMKNGAYTYCPELRQYYIAR